MDVDTLEAHLQETGVGMLRLHSLAAERSDCLQNPDLGRRVVQRPVDAIQLHLPDQAPGIALVVAEGLYLPSPSSGMPARF